MTALSPGQFARFVRAVGRRSRGQVRIPSGELAVGEAVALWRALTQAFGPETGANGGRALTCPELELLRKRAWANSAGHIGLTDTRMTLQAGLALWHLCARLGALADRSPRSGLARVAGAAVLGLAATQLAACVSMFGGNIKGSFSCGAPGGTCAPSTVIDDQALAVIQNARPLSPPGRVPAGPYFQPPANRSERTSSLVPTGSGRLAAAGGGMVHRERRVLRVVFPSYVDGAGNFHEPRVVHTVADAGGWMQVSGAAPNAGDQLAGRSQAAALAPLPSPQELAAQKAAPADQTVATAVDPGLGANLAAPAGASQVGLPDPRVVAEARAKGAAQRSTSPIEGIKAEVQARLAQTAKAPAGQAPGIVPAPTKVEAAAQTAPQKAALPSAASAPAPPLVVNPPATFSGKIEE